MFVPGAGQPGTGGAGGTDISSDDESSDDPLDVTSAELDPTAAAAVAAGDDASASDDSEGGAEQQQQQQAGVPFELTDVDVEVRLLPGASSSSSSEGPVQVHCKGARLGGSVVQPGRRVGTMFTPCWPSLIF